MRISSTAVGKAFIAASAIAAAIGFSQHVEARSVLAGIAAAERLDLDCFEVFHGSLTNRCTGTKTLVFPLFVDSAGSKTVTVTGYSPSVSSNIGCTAIGANSDSTIAGASPLTYLPQFGSPADIVLSGAYVPNSGTLAVRCSVAPNAQIYLLNWNP
jgi:hypothetical protein